MNTVGRFLCVSAVLAFTAGCNQANTDSQRADDLATAGTSGSGTDDMGPLDVADIAGNPDAYAGQTVTIVGELDEVLGPRAFTLDEDAFTRAGVDNDVLVLGADAAQFRGIDDQWRNNRVRVTGVVGRLAVVEIERELGWDLDPELEIEVERSGTVLLASSASRADTNQDAGTANPGRDTTQAFNTTRDAAAGLPETASALPLIGVVGLLCLGGGFALRVMNERATSAAATLPSQRNRKAHKGEGQC